MLSCYIWVFKKTHGLIRKNAYESNELFDNPDNIIVGFEKNERISGYIVFTFQRGIERDISGFFSLMMGVVSFNRLYEYGLAEVSDKRYIGTINMLFSAKEKPVCLTGF